MITKEMLDYYMERTNKHISLVKDVFYKSYLKLDLHYTELLNLSDEIECHDKTKFSKELMFHYILITWNYKCIREGIDFIIPNNIAMEMTKATELHCKLEKHHPEYWSSQTNVVNPDNRDVPLKCINVTNMNKLSMIQMVIDWCAVSIERNNTPMSWFKSNLNVRWHFNEDQVQFINKMIDIFWRPYAKMVRNNIRRKRIRWFKSLQR